MKKKKELGGEGEVIALEDYLKRGYNCLETNYYCAYGELDLILENNDQLIFVEVKVVDHIDDIYNYIGKKKLNFIKKSIDYYLSQNYSDKDIRLDVVFVKYGKVLEIYDDIEIY